MPNSFTLGGLPYPSPDSLLAEIDLRIKDLADALLTPLVTYNSAAAMATAGFVVQAGWTLTSFRGFRIMGGRLGWMDLQFARAAGAATITAAAGSGNIGDVDIVALPAPWKPLRRQYTHNVARTTLGAWHATIDNTGMAILTAGPPGLTVNAGDNMQLQDVFELS